MKRMIIFFIIVYVLSIIGGWALLAQNNATNAKLAQELAEAKKELTKVKTLLDAQKNSNSTLEKKISSARANQEFLSLALCPTLETTDKNALCVKNNTEWFSQTVIAGTVIASPLVKTKLETLLVALGSKKKPTSKQLYEMLRPIEAESLKALGESLK